MAAEKKPFERLPTDVVPTNYKLELQPDLKEFKFSGKLEITVDVRTVATLISTEPLVAWPLNN